MHTWNRMGDHFLELSRDRMTRWLLLFGLTMVIGQWVALLTAVPRDETFVPLHYTIYFGIDLTGSWLQLLWLPVAATVNWLILLIGARMQPDLMWRRSWAWMTGLSSLLFGLAMAMLILKVFSK